MSDDASGFLFSNANEFVRWQIALTDWFTVDQDQVDRFGEITRWTPWMHIDVECCAKENLYGGTLLAVTNCS